MIPLKSAPRWLSIAYALHGSLFILPVIMLFYASKNVGMGDFFFIQGIANLAVFVLEIPTGYIGDLFSRKNSLILGTIFWILGYLIWIIGSGFIAMLLGELIFAFAIAFISGTLEAYLYDLLKKRNKEGVFHKKYAKMQMLNALCQTITSLTGAFIFQFLGPTIPLWISIVCLLISTLILFLLPDVPESKRIVAKDKSKWQDILSISKYAIKHTEIKWLMLFPAIYGTFTFMMLWGAQSVMVIRELPIFVFSIASTANAFLRSFWAGISGKILEKIHLSGILILSVVIIAAAALGACVSTYVPVWMVYVCLTLMALASSSSSLPRMSTSVLINHRIQSNERATILSVASMIRRVFAGIGLICLKPLFDNIGVGPTFLVASLLLIPISVCAAHLYKMKLKTMA